MSHRILLQMRVQGPSGVRRPIPSNRCMSIMPSHLRFFACSLHKEVRVGHLRLETASIEATDLNRGSSGLT